MKLKDYLVAIACVVLWGLTFPVIKHMSGFVPGIFLTACRFAVIAIPVAFTAFPNMGWKRFLVYSLCFGCGQYLLSTLGIYYGLSAGIAAVIMQVQVFITIGLAYAWLHEKVGVPQVIGSILGFAGVALLLFFNTYFSVSVIGLIITFTASCCWAAVNLIVKTSKITDFTSLVAWGALPNIPILWLMSWGFGEFDKVHLDTSQLLQLAGSVIFLGLVVTFGVSVFWNGLLKKHAAIQVAPFSLLIPVVGLVSSWLWFHDTDSKQIAPLALIFAGLAVVIGANALGSRAAAAAAALKAAAPARA
ncbi:EamA family transporter [Ramlibacter sp.]|uniref:DMT family transporter n=1 Tax=Ramlibacter sp. TaxID=1917967 RepID=UPI001803B62F|nr:EamA family transporter [Ramlibacter sp.]MBA2674954.1 EamA family transporter [Ramlibacter sp.]